MRKSQTKIQLSILFLALALFSSFAYFASATPFQTSALWKDNFTDQTGISALSNINFSTGNISISNSPWFYKDHEYRKPITINGSTTNLSDYQIPINLTTALYNNTGLVGSWHFTNNDTSDSSGYGNNGAQNGGVNCTVTGKFGTGCQFDGSSGYVSIPDSNLWNLVGSSGWSVEFWANPNDLSLNRNFYGRSADDVLNGGENYLYYQTSAPVGLSWGPINSEWDTGVTLSTNQWQHIVMVYQSSNNMAYAYVNGQQMASVAVTSVGSSSGPLKIADNYNGYHFNGTIDEVRIYNRSLSAAEIAQQYQAGKARLDYQDLRFTWLNTTSSAEQNISHWLESDNQAWVKAPNVTASTVANTTLYMYYGNPSAVSASNGTNTFPTFFGEYSANDDATWYATHTTLWDNFRTLYGISGVSIEMWVKPKTLGVSSKLIGKMANAMSGENEHMMVYIDTDNKIKFRTRTSEVNPLIISSTMTVNTDRWYQVILSWLGNGDVYLYVNNVLEASDTTSLTVLMNDGSYGDDFGIMGSGPYANTATAYVDSVMIYNSVLTSEQRTSLYTRTSQDPLSIVTPQYGWYLDNNLNTAFGGNALTATGTAAYSTSPALVRSYSPPEPSVLSVGSEQRKPRSGSVGSVQITPTNFLQWQNFSADSLLGWQYKKEINISNTAAGNLMNYQVNVLLINGTNFNSSKAKANGDDIRFTAPLSYSGNGNWQYKKEITISNRFNPSALTDYQVLVSLDGAGGNGQNFDFSKAKSDGSDIRFYDPDTKSELSYWVESWNSTTLQAKVWVKIPSIAGNSDKRVWLWYGNTLANSASNGTNTFNFFDDFDGSSVDTSKWTITTATGLSVVGGELKTTSQAMRLTSVPTFSSDIILETKHRYVSTPVGYGYMVGGFFTSTSNGFGYLLQQTNADNYRYDGNWQAIGTTPPSATNILLRIITHSSTADLYVLNYATGSSYHTNTGISNTVSSEPIVLGDKYDNSFQGNTEEAYWDWVRIRKYSSVEPNITVSSSEFSINSSYVEVPYWIESWNATANSSVWVKAPFLQSGTNTTVYMYYGNAGAESASNKITTFDYANLLLYTETDPNLKYTVTSSSTTNKVDVVGETTGAATVTRTIPATGDFIFNYEYYTGSGTAWSTAVLLADTSAAGMTDAGWGSNNGVGVWMNPTSAIPVKFVSGTRTLGTDLNALSSSTLYYVTVKRVGTTLTLSVFSDAARTQSISGFPLTLSVVSTAFSNIHIANNHINQAGSRTYYIQNFYSRKYASSEPNATVSATDTPGDFSAGVADINYKILRNSQFADWKYRKAITINGSSSLLNDYQIPLNLTTAIYNNTGLVGSWHFNDGSGNRTADSSGFGNDGTMYGGMNTTLDANLTSGRVSAGKFGNALVFDGVNDYVDAGNGASLSPTSAITIETWVRVDGGAGTNRMVVAKGLDLEQYAISASNPNKFRAHLKVAACPGGVTCAGTGWLYPDGAATITLGQWYHVAETYNGSDLKLYVNGILDTSWAINQPIAYAATANKLYIGHMQGTAYPFNGTIDEVRIYNRSLSAAEIAEQYQAGKARLDYQDLRFTWLNSTSSAEQNISHWLESDNQAWVKVPNVTASSVANTTLYMYYGNPGATYNNTAGGNSTFSFFDDFSGGLGKWTSSTGTWTIPSGYLYESGTAYSRIASNTFTSISDFEFQFRFKVNDINNIDEMSYISTPNEGYGITIVDGDGYYLQKKDTSTRGAPVQTTLVGPVSWGANTAWRTAKLTKIGTTLTYYLDGVSKGSTTDSYASSFSQVVAMGSSADGRPSNYDDFRVRKLVASEPAALSIGAEQNNTLCSGITAEQAKAGYSIAGCAGNVTPISLYGALETSDPTLTAPRLRQWNVTWLTGSIVITIQSPTNTTYSSSSIWFNISLDQQGSWAGYSLNGAPNVTLANATGNWNNLNSTMSDRQHYVTFYANTSGGAMSNSATVFFTVSLPPLITIRSPENRTYDRQWIWSNATLNKAGSWCGVSLDGAANQTLANTTGKWWLNLSIPSAGTASVRFYCNNTLGAMNQSEIVFFTTTGVIGNITLNLALHLGAVFADDSLQNGNSYGCIQDGSGWFGLTSESPVSAQSGNLTSDYNLNVSFTSDNKAFLAFGKGSCANFRSRAADAQLKRFLSPLMSFSYAKTNLIQLILQFNGTDITNDAHWGKGTYLLSIANLGYNATSGKQNLAVKVVK